MKRWRLSWLERQVIAWVTGSNPFCSRTFSFLITIYNSLLDWRTWLWTLFKQYMYDAEVYSVSIQHTCLFFSSWILLWFFKIYNKLKEQKCFRVGSPIIYFTQCFVWTVSTLKVAKCTIFGFEDVSVILLSNLNQGMVWNKPNGILLSRILIYWDHNTQCLNRTSKVPKFHLKVMWNQQKISVFRCLCDFALRFKPRHGLEQTQRYSTVKDP